MKKTIALMFGISVVAGVGYLVWVYGGVGKKVLSNWLLKKWQQIAASLKVTLDLTKLSTELNKLEYEDIELLFRLTLKDHFRKSKAGTLNSKQEESATKLAKRLIDRGISKRADLTSLNNISLFGT